jgi:cytochrome c oxidase assembly protein subunit 11
MQKNNKNILLSLSAIIAGMFMLAYASVPLYNLFCRVTGYGGTPNISTNTKENVGSKEFTVFFNADAEKKLNWEFKPVNRKINTISGKHNLIFYRAKNLSKKNITGTATFNVTPLKAGKYFSKIECFCFVKQTLKPLQEMEFPVSFYIDPEIEKDPYLKDVNQITLSYSFFEAVND